MNVKELREALEDEKPSTPVVFIVDGRKFTEEPTIYEDKGRLVIEL